MDDARANQSQPKLPRASKRHAKITQSELEPAGVTQEPFRAN